GVGGVAGRRLGRLGCLLVDDFCGAGVGLLSVRGCGLRWWPLTWSSRVTVRRGLRVGEAAPRWCEAVGEAVGRWRDTERCVIVTQHVVGWGGKHGNTPKNTKGCKTPDTPLTHAISRKHTLIRGRGGRFCCRCGGGSPRHERGWYNESRCTHKHCLLNGGEHLHGKELTL